MIKRFFRKRKIRKLNQYINPDEIFLDSENLPDFDRNQFEGRLEKPIGTKTVISLGIVFFLVISIFASKVWALQIKNGDENARKSENNRLAHTLIFADRGNIYDRNGVPLAWNTPRTEESDYNLRKYTNDPGFSNILGYVKYPQKDKAGFYYEEDFIGFEGIENFYEKYIKGENGLRIVETTALQDVVSQSTIRPPKNGKSLNLTIDADIQREMYKALDEVAKDVGFVGGGGIIMDIYTGEVIALATYPEFDSNLLTNGEDKEKIQEMLTDERNPFLNRVISGLYTPGSIVKPYVALGALEEGVVTENTSILSTGEIVVPNPYNPDQPSIFRDNDAHGWVNVKEALAVSSNVYFYEVGGGFEDQRGIGIKNIEEYVKKFGFGQKLSDGFFEGEAGTVPNPEWKEKIFDGDPWRIGDTYYTAIGQYGFQVTPLQAVRAVSAIANGGTLRNPVIVKGEDSEVIRKINDIDDHNFRIVREGMRMAVTDGTIQYLNIPAVQIAAKTGTAEVGVSKNFINSWVTGFFPYNNPRYAFVIVMEKGDKNVKKLGASAVLRKVMDWIVANKPEYIEAQ